MEMMFEKDSVGSNSSSTHLPSPILGPCSSSRNSNGNVGGNANSTPPQLNRRRFASFSVEEEKEEKGPCFYCQKRGHWVRDCPNKSPKRSSPSSSSSSSSGLPNIQCPCGAGICIVRVSGTVKNPGRKFYSCPLYSVSNPNVTKCEFFKWCDKVSSDEFIEAPTCHCGAGSCRIREEISGPNAGRKFFVCPIKKGQGACSFIQLLDATNNNMEESMSSPQSTLTNCRHTSPSNSDLIEEGDFSHNGMEIKKSPLVDTPEHPQKLGTISELTRKDKVPQVDFQGQEDTQDEPLRKHYKRLRHGAPKIDGLIPDHSRDCRDLPQSNSGDPTMEQALRASVLTSEALIHQRQAEFLRQISSAGAYFPGASSTSSYYNSSALPTTSTQNCLETAAMYQILGFPSKGWCGRLVFPPSRCLTFPAPKPFFCCVFPSFDPICVLRDINMFDAEASTIVMHSTSSAESNSPYVLTPGQPLRALLWEPSGLKPLPKILGGSIMTRSILEVFEQAAVRLQDELLTMLESMDFHDHESMVLEAYSVFGALDGLFVDYKDFKDRVTEFIGRAASLTEIELSIHKEGELVDRYNSKKLQLEDISRLHAETSAALNVSNEHLQSLREEASRVKDMLLRIEAELSSCEAEKMEIGTRLDEITEDMLESERSFQVASEEAKEALKLCQHREARGNVAKASFEMARFKLRRSCNVSFLM